MADFRRSDGLAAPVRPQVMYSGNFGSRIMQAENTSMNRQSHSMQTNSIQGQPQRQADQPAQTAGSYKIGGIQKKLQRVKALNSKLSDVVPEAKLILQLVEMERRISAECERAKCELEDLTSTPEPSNQVLRITVFNTHPSLQSSERSSAGSAPSEHGLNGPEAGKVGLSGQATEHLSSWTLHIAFDLVHSEMGDAGSDQSKVFGVDRYFEKVLFGSASAIRSFY